MNSKLRECNQLSQFTGSTLVEASPPPTIGHPPDMHRVLLNSDGQAIGACSIWWRHTPAYRDQSVGYKPAAIWPAPAAPLPSVPSTVARGITIAR
ncbi:MAG: hypothetical protein LW697_10810 [Blastopirellula sp.]|nr:hypothetical protein [Blastopirellula sp.]